MKTLIFNLVAVLLLVSCSTSEPQSVGEETEYANYVAALNAKMTNKNISPMEKSSAFQQAYQESGLQKLVLGSLLDGAQLPSVDQLSVFYNDVIIGKYNGHISQGQLKLAFISSAVKSLDLSGAKEKEFITKLTRDLIALDEDTKPELTYTCLAASKDLFGKDEFNQMVKKARFQTRLNLDQMKEKLDQQKAIGIKEQVEQVNIITKLLEKNMTDLEALAVN